MTLPSSSLLNRFRIQLTRARTEMQKMMKRLKELTEPPLVYATVVQIESQTKAPTSSFGCGAYVRVMKSNRHQALIGLTGFVLSDEPEDTGEVLVGFENGSRGFFGIGLADRANSGLELALVNLGSGNILVALDGRLVELAQPAHLTLQVGQGVLLSQKTQQIVKVITIENSGSLASVKRLVGALRAEVDLAGQSQIVAIAGGLTDLEPGHQVRLDPNGRVIVENLGFDDGRFAPKKFKPVTWDQVGGYADLKLELQEMLEESFDPAVAATIDESERVRGILFHGPGGTGKTYMVRALYTAMLKQYEKRQITESGFFNIEAAELLEGIVGATEKLMRRTVNRAIDFSKRNGVPAVILLNEVDAIAKRRGTGVSSDVNDSNVPMLLGLMDGFEKNDIIWVFVTNRLDVLDPELIRDGRIDRMFFVGRADQAAATEIFRIHLSTKPLGDEGIEALVSGAVSALYDQSKVLYELSFRDSDERRSFTLGHLACGALIENAVKQAAKLARRRSKQAGVTGPAKLTLADLQGAIETIYLAKQLANILNDVHAFLGEDAERLKSAKRRLRQVQA